MLPKTITIVNRLSLGDRFYKISDKTRTVYELVPGVVKRTKFRMAFGVSLTQTLHQKPSAAKLL